VGSSPAGRIPNFGLTQRSDSAKQVFFTRDAGHLVAQLPVFEEEQSRDGADVVLERKALIFIYVNLPNLDRARFFARNLIQQRGDHFTGTAPFCPKIDNHRLVALGHFAVKIGVIEIDSSGVVHCFRKGKSKSE
jgi:hypothetical protein